MSKYIFNDAKKMLFMGDNTILFENNQVTIRHCLPEKDYNLLVNLSKSFSIIDDKDFSQKTFEFLVNNEVLEEAPENIIKSFQTSTERTELFMHKFDNINNISLLQEKIVLFVGAGGICSEIINQLLAVGIKKYVIIDFDNISISNLNRQFVYKRKQIGQLKTKVLKKYIKSVSNEASVMCYNKFISKEEDLIEILDKNHIDIIVNAADTPPLFIQKIILKASKKYNTPVIFGGVGVFEGHYGPLFNNNNDKNNYITKLDRALSKIKYIFPCKSSFGVTNTLIATYMAWDIIFFLLDRFENVKSLNRELIVKFKENGR